MRARRQQYQQQVQTHIQTVLDQQKLLLQRLAQNLFPALQAQDLLALRAYLAAYEDQLFVAAKQNLAVPMSLRIVKLSVPTQIINSNGYGDPNSLVPNENYYLRSMHGAICK